MDQPEVRNNMRRLRFDRGGMTQQSLADRVGVVRQTIIAIEAGKYAPSLLLAFRIARSLEARIEEVFQFEGAEVRGQGPEVGGQGSGVSPVP